MQHTCMRERERERERESFFFFWIDNQRNIIEENRKEEYKLFVMMNNKKRQERERERERVITMSN